ncbi:type VI secretion system (T6SS) phospholipase Tle1-like effector [Cupriavidus metallidurans]|jgi:hypothetical protein|uniref:T6SS phospholipase effector Tle1-like catalytic domain-containing protein n=1 Tax=Cupriavidus TaxID=106589 RepID=UPI0006903C9A|nr:DUF2235 domain-containing protein [Cupriavidus metallidurans]KWW33343.1 hypothetical protein AU374_05323 [Cupriavidus metallidurans]MDE4922418.1 DUF2235 domain-containing protein [Cupriavidus metallidurans]
MQDWFTDCHKAFAQTVHTQTELYAKEFNACATCEQQPWFSFFFDGTGNHLDVDKPLHKLSNIARLYEGHVDNEQPLIDRFYYPGVGTPLNASDPNWWETIRDSKPLGGGTGLGGDVRLANAERDLSRALKANHKVTRIDIAVFGFSRGATLARAFVNRLLAKCAMKDGVRHWPCPTARDGVSAPLHVRILGIFDTVESVGLPARNLTDMCMYVPKEVERCVHIFSGHELRAFFPLTPVRGSDSKYEEIAFPGVHSDIGGGYRPDEQARTDLLARIALNRMRLEATRSGVPFSPPTDLKQTTKDLFEYDQTVKALFDEYMNVVGPGNSLEDQVFQHMRLFYGWLKARFGQAPCEVYQNVCSTNQVINEELQKIQQYHARIKFDADTMNWRAYLTHLWKTDRSEYKRTIETAGGERETNRPLSDEQLRYWNTWLNPPELSANLIRFFDQYVHDSRAGFLNIDSSGYLQPRQIIDGSVPPKATAPASPADQPAMSAA